MDTETNKVVNSVVLPERVRVLAVSGDGNRVYATTSFVSFSPRQVVRQIPDYGVYVIDARTNTVSGGIEGSALGVSLSSDDRTAYLVDDAVRLVDTATNTVVNSIPLPINFVPSGAALVLAPDRPLAYVAPFFSVSGSPFDIQVIDLKTNTLTTSVAIPCKGVCFSIDLAISPTGLLYLPVFGSGDGPPPSAPCPGDCNEDGQVTISELIIGVDVVLGFSSFDTCPELDTDSNQQVSVDELVGAVGVALGGCPIPTPVPGPTPSGHNFLSVLNTHTNKIVSIIAFGGAGPGSSPLRETGDTSLQGVGIDITPDGRFAYVAGCNGGVCVVDTALNEITATIDTGVPGKTQPVDVAITQDGKFAYVTEVTTGVIVIDTHSNTVVSRILLQDPTGVVIGPDN